MIYVINGCYCIYIIKTPYLNQLTLFHNDDNKERLCLCDKI